MSFMKWALNRFSFSFVRSSIGRLIAELEDDINTKSVGAYSKEVDYILLAPRQAQALEMMKKYASRQQVQELLELYEKANSVRPIDLKTAKKVAKNQIFQPQEQKELHR